MADWPVSLAEIKLFLRIDGEEENSLLATFLAAAQEHTENYLNASLPAEVPTPMKLALLVLVCHFYEERAGEEIPPVVYTLLSPYRNIHW